MQDQYITYKQRIELENVIRKNKGKSKPVNKFSRKDANIGLNCSALFTKEERRCILLSNKEIRNKKEKKEGFFGRYKFGLDLLSGRKVGIKIQVNHPESKVPTNFFIKWVLRLFFWFPNSFEEENDLLYELGRFVGSNERVSDQNKKLYSVQQHYESASKHNLSSEDAEKAIISALIELHLLQSKGVIHRDLHKDNLILTEDAEIKIIDFGLSIKGGIWLSIVNWVQGLSLMQSAVKKLRLSLHSNFFIDHPSMDVDENFRSWHDWSMRGDLTNLIRFFKEKGLLSLLEKGTDEQKNLATYLTEQSSMKRYTSVKDLVKKMQDEDNGLSEYYQNLIKSIKGIDKNSNRFTTTFSKLAILLIVILGLLGLLMIPVPGINVFLFYCLSHVLHGILILTAATIILTPIIRYLSLKLYKRFIRKNRRHYGAFLRESNLDNNQPTMKTDNEQNSMFDEEKIIYEGYVNSTNLPKSKDKPVVLISCGSHSPPHHEHMMMIYHSYKRLLDDGYEVDKILVYSVDDESIKNKYVDCPENRLILPHKNRCVLLNMLVNELYANGQVSYDFLQKLTISKKAVSNPKDYYETLQRKFRAQPIIGCFGSDLSSWKNNLNYYIEIKREESFVSSSKLVGSSNLNHAYNKMKEATPKYTETLNRTGVIPYRLNE